ncbi:Rossmann fold domain-containing protein [Sphingomonas sp. 28-63-12]|uniref:Rossmann fold domain-containing protein n=1 Tax=Sphingomonas sp. 28-63-12 TaxID=1970434 RepID=UPI000BC5A07E|nr:MAG: hypothetical protein B7Y47_13800 [Sphingomonas sp. 28-63-12]
MIDGVVEGQGALVHAIAAAVEDQDGTALVSRDHAILVASDSLAATIDAIRQCVATAIVVIVPADWAPLDRHLLVAAIEPLAIELAPATRVNALDIAPGAQMADIAAAAIFLLSAQSVTGQILAIEQRPDAN